MYSSILPRLLLILLIGLSTSGMWFVRAPHVQAQGAQSGLIGDEGSSYPDETSMTPASTLNGVQIGFARENNRTTIWLRVCADSPNFQFRSEMVGHWITGVFHQTAARGGCSPSTTSWWRMVYNAVPGPQLFRIYATANDTRLSEAAFMERATRADCVVTGIGTGRCTPSTNPGPFSAPRVVLDTPSPEANIGETLVVSGWAVDTGAWSGTGVNQVEVLLNGTPLGLATYGGDRPDVATALGDSRFRASHFSFTTSTRQLPKGPATLQIRSRSTITGNNTTLERQISISNLANSPPNPPILVAPGNSATITAASVTLQLQDAGDPDNGPNQSRTFRFRITKTDGSWAQESAVQSATSWSVTLPSPGAYQWQAQSNDGAANSTFAEPWSLSFSPAERILNVRYVDQVFAQRQLINGWWRYCGPATLAMLLHYYGAEKRDVFTNRAPTVELAQEMRVGIDAGGTPRWRETMPAALQRRGLSSVVRSGVMSVAELKASIDNGHPVLMHVAGYDHFMILVGYRANGNFVVHDSFGGRFWPQDWHATANRNDVPFRAPFDTPRTKGATLPGSGQYVEYSYAELTQHRLLRVTGTLRVTGAQRPLQLITTTIDQENQILSGEEIQVHFAQAAVTAPAAIASMRVMYEPRSAPEQPIDRYAGALATFRLSAVDATSSPLQSLAEPFTMQVSLDRGDVREEESSESVSTSPTEESRPKVVLARWDETTQSWSELPTHIDPITRLATAQSSLFGDFALLIPANSFIHYLPVVQRR